jgi:asparagine synthase (glutamine-hydrolysing)
MCGIHGFLRLDGASAAGTDVLQRMGRVTRHRGPDDEGMFVDGPAALGMRRLSIIDLSGGHQPIANEDDSLVVVCNGEIYNFRELRTELQARGHRFRTGSDVEVILHGYEEYGDDFVSRLDGMFGFALWDRKRRRLLLGRDAVGIKPLYLYRDARQLAFASEAKALFELPGIACRVDTGALSDYVSFGYSPGPGSLFAGITKLESATLLIAEDGRVTTRRYWQLPQTIDRTMRAEDWAGAVRARLESAVREQMVSDVPLGGFLSGGIDSSCVVGLMARHSSKPVKTYSIGFRASSGAELYNELPYARRVAELFHTEHHEIVVQPNVVKLLPQLLWHMDEPMADAALITTYLVSEFARRDVTVILSGVGGDELFGGYHRYRDEYFRARYHLLPRWLRRGVVTPLARALPSDRHSRWLNVARLGRAFLLADELDFETRYERFVQVFDPEARARLLGGDASQTQVVRNAFAQATSPDALARLMAVDFATQLPDDLLLLTDKMSMATSLECRVPLLDRQLVEMAAKIPTQIKMRGGELKSLLKASLAGLLPNDILHRPKRGFGAPVGAWIKAELAPLLTHVLSRRAVEQRGWLRWPAVAETIEMHRQQRADHTDHLMCLMNLELWARLYVDRVSSDDLGAELQSVLAA